ncbi:MAG: hypothetical protein M1816_008024 [Peltula sp. TS41687]|nr:MAG: hypothetical protein M1816_008024 [Peltula sp. TS41687]
MADNYTYPHFAVSFPKEHVAAVEINRADKLNTFTFAMFHELRTLFNRLSTDPSVRAIVLSGAGPKAFSAGLDLHAATQTGPLAPSASGSQDPARSATALRRHVLELQACVSSIEACEKPVICILHGHSLGLALDIATCADIRLCTRTTGFGVKEVDIGLAADVGTLSRLPKAVGSASWVRDVCLTGRVFGAEEAYRVGLVSGVFETKEKAVQEGLGLAETMAAKSPVAVQGTKEVLNYSRDHTVMEGLRYTAVWNGAALQATDVQTAMRATMQRRRPTFEKL